MDTVVLVLMFLVTFMTGLKLTFLKVWQMAVVAAVCALFIALIWPLAIQQSRNEIAEWLGNPQLMLDTSVILTLEVLWQMAYCLLAGKLLYGKPVKKRTIWIYRVLRFFPGILIFPVLFYALVQLIYALPGSDFSTVAYSLAAGTLVAFPAFAFLIKLLLPEKDLRQEILFLCAALVLILGIVATVNGTTSFKGSDPVEWGALGAFIGLTLVCAVVGYVIYNYKLKKLNKN